VARIPPVVKVTKDNVEYISRVDRTNYLIEELVRSALRDVGKFLRRRMLDKVRKLPGMKRGPRPRNAFQYWVRRRDGDLWIGIKHNTWYGVQQELGSKNQPKRSIVRDTTFENIDEIRRIEGQYLSAVEDENKALGLIDPENDGSDDQ